MALAWGFYFCSFESLSPSNPGEILLLFISKGYVNVTIWIRKSIIILNRVLFKPISCIKTKQKNSNIIYKHNIINIILKYWPNYNTVLSLLLVNNKWLLVRDGGNKDVSGIIFNTLSWFDCFEIWSYTWPLTRDPLASASWVVKL